MVNTKSYGVFDYVSVGLTMSVCLIVRPLKTIAIISGSLIEKPNTLGVKFLQYIYLRVIAQCKHSCWKWSEKGQ